MSSQDISFVLHPTSDVVGAISKGNETVSHIRQVPTNMVAMMWLALMAVGPFECNCRVGSLTKRSRFSVVFHPTTEDVGAVW